MENIYLPVDDVSEFACYSIVGSDTIRAYNSIPRVNSSSNYVDFYINSHYLEKEGTQTWGQYSSLPSCISSNSITNDFYYRNDLSDIMIIFFIMLIICFYFPVRVVCRLFRRFL